MEPLKKVICPVCGKKQYVDKSFLIIICKYCGHQWLEKGGKDSYILGFICLILFVALWIFISKILIWHTNLSTKDSYIIGLIIFIIFMVILDIPIRIIQYLSKKK
jgi:ribosomal protein S27E